MIEAERERYLQILRQHDDGATGWETPLVFDHAAATARFQAFTEELRRSYGQQFRAEADIQDASFCGQIFLGPSLLIEEPTPPATVLLRVSNWGDLATVSDEDALTEAGLEQVKELLIRHNYVYIPPQILALPYSGKLPTNGAVSWWLRYFDWV